VTPEDLQQSQAEDVIAEKGYSEYLAQVAEQEADFWQQIKSAGSPEQVAQICDTHPCNNTATCEFF
jgi:hypothetical protein